ncbi:alpha-2-glucosyltransferase Alg10 [Neohortaea acidophila]|uniref:Dol-P-Glc:Glc(2)Man(9)GlcNAc(2)-PP-Dol alpha-1,2-glucosyltransferase n=1 Tax=Neohortaea acidophila TaxID=245834 RepID=A0A6A6PIV5_9PEZI|nr:alpha-2-glucosyltransferase Alg10 [Neohortaea acidophila]KAF2479922.1 alpha-2-glucosyltransferase Alg10 [Neohortaea acidophila]
MALVPAAILLAGWWEQVSRKLPDPYLDEVFHVGQVRHYLAGRLRVWDPKITTPPGLYLLSYAVSPADSSLRTLRALGLVCLLIIPGIVILSYTQRQRGRREPWAKTHNAVNIALMPPLFFFSALYYTDVPSTLSVLVFYSAFLSADQQLTWWKYPMLILLGLASLLFRQTNIFWVALFPAGLSLVRLLDQGPDVARNSMYKRADGFGDSFISVLRTSWRMNVVYDPSVRDAWLEDYFKTVISLAVCLIRLATQPRRLVNVLLALVHYLAIIAAFAAFIIWNGGVVLGDKSNHVATLHLPQMLYIWPYFTFFSWPILLPYLSTLPLGIVAKISQFAPLESMLVFKRRHLVPRFWLMLASVSLACLVVRFNTIVHPFLLADNRHYTFYVFRLLTRRWWVKYAVTPIYVVCGWATMQALGARPFDTPSAQPTSSKTKPPQKQSYQPDRHLIPTGQTSANISFVLVWLATTTLQLITAPLVEPRYLILPWIFWRMHVPLQQYTATEGPNSSAKTRNRLDYRLYLETAWFLVVNAATCYIFLNWGFAWPQEPGKIQRFMW